MSKRRRWALRILLLLVTAEAAATLGLRAAGVDFPAIRADSLSPDHRRILGDFVSRTDTYLAHDAELGWDIRPGATSGPLRANGLGLRAEREVSPASSPGKVRVVSFGDSFTHGDGVSHAETWQEVWNRRNRGVEVLNAGVAGYGPDQAYLRYRRLAPRLGARVVLIGFMSENVNRVVNVFRPYYYPGTGIPLAKPRYLVEAGRLTLIPNPLRDRGTLERLLADDAELFAEMGRHDYWYRSRPRKTAADRLGIVRLFRTVGHALRGGDDPGAGYREDFPGLPVVRAVLEAFYRRVLADGALPVIVVFPLHSDLQRAPAYAPLVARLRGLRIVDLADAFRRYAPDYDLPFHYDAEGHRVVARYLDEYARRAGLDDPARVRALWAAER